MTLPVEFCLTNSRYLSEDENQAGWAAMNEGRVLWLRCGVSDDVSMLYQHPGIPDDLHKYGLGQIFE